MKQTVLRRGSRNSGTRTKPTNAGFPPVSARGRGRPRKVVAAPVFNSAMLQVMLGERQAEATAAAWFRAPLQEMRKASRRTANISEARQVGMYLAHTVLCRSMTRVGHVFGRDRTTVRHACARIEDLRDGAALDHALDIVGAALLHWSTEFANHLSAGEEH